MEDQSGHTRGR